MLKHLFLVLQAFSTDSFSISNNFTRDNEHLYIPLNIENFFIIAKKNVGYREISELKYNLNQVITNISDADINNKQLIALQASIKHSIKIIEENNLENIIFKDVFSNEVEDNIVAIIHKENCVLNNGMNEYLLKSSLQKLENQNFFNIHFQNGEVFGFKVDNLSIIVQSDKILNENIYLRIEFKIHWLTSLLNEHELNISLENRVREKTKELKLLASRDSMTKLYNRGYFSEISEHMFNVAKRENSHLSTIMIDVDYFKKVNDTFGHHFGDTVLIKLAELLSDSTRQSDIVCRWGGEEFLIILVNTNIEKASLIAEKIRTKVENLVLNYNNSIFNFTISLGISTVDFKRDIDIDIAINKADNALYTAKNKGRNRVCINSNHTED